MTDNDFTVFLLRVGFIVKDKCKRVSENSNGFIKTDTMFPNIASSGLLDK